uniref:Uncharacterized protein n=1 Tax=Meloidogyne enterolobii TaxID=390850 RepID=A0A6V7V005_MELEN|nr:unnamed protein product [Meloidogyne enterolobii]
MLKIFRISDSCPFYASNFCITPLYIPYFYTSKQRFDRSNQASNFGPKKTRTSVRFEKSNPGICHANIPFLFANIGRTKNFFLTHNLTDYLLFPIKIH